MGRKKDPGDGNKAEEKPAQAEAKEADAAEEVKPEDPPIVKTLKELDDKYLEIERQYEKEVQELQKKFAALQAPLLEQRKALLAESAGVQGEDAKTGTPALKGFWLQALQNLPAMEDQIEEWDEPVLEYLTDITKSYLDESDLQKGFKLHFHFAENPFFTNDVLWKEYHTQEGSPYTGEIDTTEIKVCTIDWKAGKNVTVETVKKKTKGGGAKKAKQKAKEKEEPRDSFFRGFFRHLRPDLPIPEDVNLEEARQLCEDSEDEDEEEMMSLLIENDYEIGCSVRDQLIPFAVRWYTGEASPEDDFDEDDEDEEEEEEDGDEEEDDEESEEDEPPPRRGRAPPAPKKRGGDDKKKSGDGNAAGGKAEECKQQ